MILRDKCRKVSGATEPGYWYVVREEGGTYTISRDITKALDVTEAEGRAFNKRHNTCWEIAKSAIRR